MTTLDAEIKTRVPQSVKTSFETLAEKRGLKPADLQREAFREFIERNEKSAGNGAARKGAKAA